MRVMLDTNILILRASISSGVEYFLTGDKDFLEASIPGLKIVSVQEFLSMI